MRGWEGKLLSQASQEVLIKAIPAFAMGCFKLPLGLCHEVEVVIRKFWWGQRGEKRKIHWLNWDKMTKNKAEGGMGFHDLALYSDSLLAKQAWRLMQDKSSLFYKVFKLCFFTNCTIMEASESRNSSYAWKSILHGRDVLHRGTCWRIGNGHLVKIWQHSWLLIKHLTRVPSHAVTGLEDAKVELLIHAEQRT